MSKNMLALDQIKVESEDIVETGDYDLEGLFIRLGYAIDSIGAKRIVLDTIESIFSSFSNALILRSELRRLFQFLKDKGVTAVITGERGDDTLTRHGLEEYVSDAVVILDNRIIGNIATRRLRILKYRGSHHGTNEYPFLIDENGFSVLPITSLGLTSGVTEERVSTGVEGLDAMIEGRGYFKGSTVLINGQAGTGKTSFGASFIRTACEAGKKGVFLAYEESPAQIMRNMRSIGIDLQRYQDDGLLQIHAGRPTSLGLEMHLVTIHKIIKDFRPDVVVIDPISSLMSIGPELEVHSTLVRMVDLFKMEGITAVLTDLRHDDKTPKSALISSLVDTWILLENVEANGEINRILRLMKSRGMAHSNQLREFRMTNDGIELIPPYIGPEGVLTGSARYTQEAKERADEAARAEEISRLRSNLEQHRTALTAQVKAMQAEFTSKEAELEHRIAEEERRRETMEASKRHMKFIRMAGMNDDR